MRSDHIQDIEALAGRRSRSRRGQSRERLGRGRNVNGRAGH